MEELINKIQLSPKIMSTSSRRFGGSSPESYSFHPATVILLPRTRFAIITGINHKIQNCKGEFIIKRTNTKSKQPQLARNIGKHYEFSQHSLFNSHIQKLFIIHIPMYFQHQSIFHFHIILNIDIISSQCVINNTITSIHIHIIINNNINSC